MADGIIGTPARKVEGERVDSSKALTGGDTGAVPTPAVRVDEALARAESSPGLATALTWAREAWEVAEAAPHLDQARRVRSGHALLALHYRLGHLREVVELGERLMSWLVAPPVHESPDTARHDEILRWTSAAACELGLFDIGLGFATRLIDAASQSGSARRQVLAANSLAGALERMGDPWQAARLLEEQLPLARSVDEIWPLYATLNNLCAVSLGAFYLLRDAGEAAEAQATLVRAEAWARETQQMAPRLNDTMGIAVAYGNLGDVLLHRGELVQAGQLLDEALEFAQRHGHTAQAWRIRCTVGELHLARGRPDETYRQLDALLIAMKGADPRTTQMRAHHAMYRACRALGRSAEALEHLETLTRLERSRMILQLRAQSAHLTTRAEAERHAQTLERLKLRTDELELLTERDPLTGLGNVRQVNRQLPAMLSLAAGSGQPFVLAAVDIDYFKQINDTGGHAAGDRVLEQLALMLRENLRTDDLVARIGGDEFLIGLPDTHLGRALEVCERLRATVAAYPWHHVAEGLRVSLSIGLSPAPPHDAARLRRNADQALYRAKAAGRDRIMV